MNRKAYLAAGTPRDGYQRLPGTPRAPLKAVCPDVQVKRRLALNAGWVSRATRWPATSNSRFRGCFPDMHHSARLRMTSVFRAVCLCPHTLNVPLHSASEPSERGSLVKLRSHVLSRIHCAGGNAEDLKPQQQRGCTWAGHRLQEAADSPDCSPARMAVMPQNLLRAFGWLLVYQRSCGCAAPARLLQQSRRAR